MPTAPQKGQSNLQSSHHTGPYGYRDHKIYESCPSRGPCGLPDAPADPGEPGEVDLVVDDGEEHGGGDVLCYAECDLEGPECGPRHCCACASSSGFGGGFGRRESWTS